MRKKVMGKFTAVLLITALLGTSVLSGCTVSGKQGTNASEGADLEANIEAAANVPEEDASLEDGKDSRQVDIEGFRFHEFFRETEVPMGKEDTWTIFLYMCGSNLESENGSASFNLMQVMNGLPEEGVNVIVQTGGAESWGDIKTWKENTSEDYIAFLTEEVGMDPAEPETAVIDPEKLQRFLVTDQLTLLDEQPLASMADPDTLYEFLSWGVKNYPAEHMGVVLWDHGGGSLSGACQDELFDNIMLPFQIEEAFSNLAPEMTDRFEFIGFDACLMATVEIANMLQPYGRYLYASEESEPGFGWDYTPVIEALNRDPGMDGAALGEILCNGFMAFYRELEMQDTVTLSVTDLSAIDPVLAALDDMTEGLLDLQEEPTYLGPIARETARAERYMAKEMTDLGDLASNLGTMLPEESKALQDAVSDAVVYSVSGQARSFATGLSVFYPAESDTNGLLLYEYSAPTDTYADFIRTLQSEQFRRHLMGERMVAIEGEPEHEHDGTYRMDIDPKTLNYVREAGHLLFVDAEGENSIFLGSSNDIDIDYETGAVRDSFDGTWAFLSDVPLMLNLEEFFDGYSIYLSPVLLNGNRTNLILQWTVEETEENGGHYEIIGTYVGVDPTTGMSSRTMRSLRSGDVVEPLYLQVKDEDVLSEEDVEFSDETATYVSGEKVMIGSEPKVESGLLDAEDRYLYQFYVIDIYGNQQTFVPTEMHVGEEPEETESEEASVGEADSDAAAGAE